MRSGTSQAADPGVLFFCVALFRYYNEGAVGNGTALGVKTLSKEFFFEAVE